MIFKKKKTVLEEQPLCYWEESSYMMAVPKEGGMDLSVRLFERVAAISGVELLKKRLPDEDEPGYMEVGYDGEVYEIGFYEGDFSMPDMFIRGDYYFTADRALTVFMKFGVDGQKSYHLQLKIAVAMVPDLLAIVDESAEKLVCARWATLAADSAVVPGTSVLFTVHAVTDEGGEVWLHTHGLNRCGLYELEILKSDKENYNNHYYLISTLASHLLDKDDRTPEPGGQRRWMSTEASLLAVRTTVRKDTTAARHPCSSIRVRTTRKRADCGRCPNTIACGVRIHYSLLVPVRPIA